MILELARIRMLGLLLKGLGFVFPGSWLTSDEMDDGSAFGELVEGCEGFCGDGGIECVWAECNYYFKVF